MSSALFDGDTNRALELFNVAAGVVPPADVFGCAADDAHRRMRSALLWWAGSTAVNPDGFSVLADAYSSVREPSTRPVRMLPRFDRIGAGDVGMLPGFEGGLPSVKDAILPGFEGVSASVPSWLLAVYDAAGGAATDVRSKAAPWLLRLFVGSLLSLPPAFRNGRQQMMPLDTGTLARWLQPGGWSRRPADFDKLRAALNELQNLRVPLPSGDLQVVTCTLLPRVFGRGRSPQRSPHFAI